MAQVGSAIRIRVDIYDRDAGLLYDPADGVFITIMDKEAAVKINLQAMTKTVVGKYKYIWQSSTTDRVGEYAVTISDDDGTYTYVEDRHYFVLT